MAKFIKILIDRSQDNHSLVNPEHVERISFNPRGKATFHFRGAAQMPTEVTLDDLMKAAVEPLEL